MTPIAMRSNTIFAVATGFGRAAITVIRISGPQTRFILETIAGGVPEPRRLVLRRLRAPGSGEVLDQALVAWMPGPRSFTGEDQAELHVHGGVAARSAVVRALSRLPECHPAAPGEFTRRAFLNGRMDLSSVEGLADLIDAETEAQRRQALRQLEGALGGLAEVWRERLIEALALLEAALDFSDEGDVPANLESAAALIVRDLATAVGGNLADARRGERLRDGFMVVLAGPPNAGKSTLLNALARRDVAIVADIPGTTRDAIEVRCDLGGLPVVFVDTAGLRQSEDPIEQAGMARTRARLGSADLTLWLIPPDGLAQAAPPVNGPVLRVATKADLSGTAGAADVWVSAVTGAGLQSLLDRIEREAETALGQGDAVITRERHRAALTRAHDALGRVAQALEEGQTELAAEDVRLAVRAIGEISGRVDVEQVLDRLFATFCIGK
ncbi:MAG TPA: tRNA uridine-5-carboxymethylaminomethyl(34) synthesis GTPase MnmE [Beijerinckiaceae bacterium]|nr:tRNA uridine-5-carboxymethylaminomethyl(34) synthesis GTPase MnmE [Beijerinckiaceae bacterium]